MADESTSEHLLRAAVYGSCVARDSVDLAARESIEVVDYIARQSLVSGGRDASEWFSPSQEFSHNFQRRVLAADFRGDVEKRVRDLAGRTDVLLWDLTDERHGVHVLPGGSIITRSVDLIAVPSLRDLADRSRSIEFGTDEHFRLWSGRAEHLKKVLVQIGMMDRTVVIHLPWALIGLDGKPTPSSMGVTAVEANQLFERYYAFLAELGFTFIEIDDEQVIADPDHRWGAAPFHYVQDVYDEIMRQVFEFSRRHTAG